MSFIYGWSTNFNFKVFLTLRMTNEDNRLKNFPKLAKEIGKPNDYMKYKNKVIHDTVSICCNL